MSFLNLNQNHFIKDSSLNTSRPVSTCCLKSSSKSAEGHFINKFGLLTFFAQILIGAYRSIFSAHFGGACLYEPSCSEYANKAFQKHSFFIAIKLTLRRIVSCRPGRGGYDPVP